MDQFVIYHKYWSEIQPVVTSPFFLIYSILECFKLNYQEKQNIHTRDHQTNVQIRGEKTFFTKPMQLQQLLLCYMPEQLANNFKCKSNPTACS